jgi:hypothetical protein
MRALPIDEPHCIIIYIYFWNENSPAIHKKRFIQLRTDNYVELVALQMQWWTLSIYIGTFYMGDYRYPSFSWVIWIYKKLIHFVANKRCWCYDSACFRWFLTRNRAPKTETGSKLYRNRSSLLVFIIKVFITKVRFVVYNIGKNNWNWYTYYLKSLK